MQEILNIVSIVITSIGGTSVVILGLAKYIGNITANILAEKNRAKIEKEIAEYKTKYDKILEHSLYVSKLNYENEYKIYKDIWDKLNRCVISTCKLFPIVEDVPVDENDVQKFNESKYNEYVTNLNEFGFCVDIYAPFYIEELYNAFNELRRSCIFIGNKFKLYKIDVKKNLSYSAVRNLTMKIEEEKEIYEKKTEIVKNKEDLIIKIRDYLNDLKIK